MKYLVFGETLWDVYPDKKVIGGAAFNFAAHSAILGENVSFITGVGYDRLGDETIACIAKYGIRTDFVCRNEKETGMCIVSLDENGIPTFRVLTDTAYDHIDAEDGLIERVKELGADLMYINTLSQRGEKSRRSLRYILDSVDFDTIFCDVNIRVGCCDADSLQLCLSRADIVKISDEEAHYIADFGLISSALPFEQALYAAFPNLKMLLFTMGGEGSVVYDYVNGTEIRSGKPEKVDVISTVGAGDCYGASFVHVFMDGGDITSAVKFASERCLDVVSSIDAIPKKFLSNN